MRKLPIYAAILVAAVAGGLVSAQERPLALTPGAIGSAPVDTARIAKLEALVLAQQKQIDALQLAQKETAAKGLANQGELSKLRKDYLGHSHFQVLATYTNGKQDMMWRTTTIPAAFCQKGAAANWADEVKCTASAN